MRTLWGLLRIVAAALALTAVVVMLTTTLRSATARDEDLAATTANFFSLFTIVGSLGSAIVLLVAGGWTLRARRGGAEPAALGTALTVVSAWMILTGVVFQLLLRAIDPPPVSTVDYLAREFAHIVMPIFFAVDTLVAPGRRPLRWRTLLLVLLFPLLWGGYTLIRGPFVPDPNGSTAWWYPYPFLDPNASGGYLSVATYIVIIAAGMAVLGTVLIVISRVRARLVGNRRR